MKKHWWIIIIIIIIVVGYFLFFNKTAVEYSEIRDNPHIMGNPEASVVLVEFSDFQCPACGSAASFVKNLLDEFGDNIKFEYRHFPLSNHIYAFKAAEASECATDQEKFWVYHDKLFLNQDNLSKKDLISYATEIEGLDVELWQDCLNSKAKAFRVKEDITEANNNGYMYTPTFILNGQLVEEWTSLSELIKALIEPVQMQENGTSTQSYLRNVKFSS